MTKDAASVRSIFSVLLAVDVSGVPGTGKTATVHKVISLLKESVEAEEISAFDFLEINGMMHSESSSIYSRLYATIFRSRCANGASIRLLDNHFRSGFATSRRLTIVLLDELDQLVQKKQKLAYNLFEWAHCAGSRLVVIAVANTMDLPERVFKHKIASRLGGSRVNFTPYTHPQLLHILELTAARFSDVKINSSAMEFVCRKIAAVNGDARRLIQAFHRLREAAFASGTGTVTIPLAQKVLAASDTSGSLSGALSGVPFMQLLLLCCCFNQLKRKETTELLFSSVLPLFLQTCQTKTLPLPDIRDISCWLNALNTAQFLHTSFPAHSCLENAKVSLLVGEQELSEACSFDTTLKRLVGV